MKFLERDGVRLAYEEVGSGDPPMVFIHGWICDHSYFAPQADFFSRWHRVVSVDLRGHGESDRPDGRYTIEALADDVAWVHGELGIERSLVVGHSMGALIALAMASAHPGLVAKAVLVDPAPLAAPPEILEVLGQLTDSMDGDDPSAARGAIIDSLFLPSDDPDLRDRVMAEMAEAPNHVAVGCFRGIVAFDGATALRALEIPVLVVNAARPINDPERLSSLCPTLSHVETPGVGHFNQLLAPDLVNGLIAEFVR